MVKLRLAELKDDLKNFGLRPSEWKLKASKRNVYVIHRQDTDVCFCGQIGFNIANKKFALRNLTLVGV